MKRVKKTPFSLVGKPQAECSSQEVIESIKTVVAALGLPAGIVKESEALVSWIKKCHGNVLRFRGRF
ncbi:MAG: hypothetical protein ACTSP4_01675 [Candidatus Hodarchaeales archaeon]